MVQTVSKLRGELGRPAELVQDLVSDHREQVKDIAGDLTQRVRDLPDAATRTGKAGMRKTKKNATRQAKRLSKSINPPKARRISAPLVVLVLAVVAAALYRRSKSSSDTVDYSAS